MKKHIQHIALLVKPKNQQAKNLALKISSWLQSKNIKTTSFEQTEDLSFFCRAKELEQPNLILVLGGDGTMLGAARAILKNNIPILGINFGKVGFLTGLSPKQWQEGLNTLINKKFDIQKCSALSCTLLRNEEIIAEKLAINDIVINRGNIARLIDLDIWLEQDYLGCLRADGLIVATPTGSSAYSVSAGGPLILEQVPVFSLTPICPFLNNLPPLIYDCQKKLIIRTAKSNIASDIHITLDGQESLSLKNTDSLKIIKAKEQMQLITLPELSFFKLLRDKGFIKNLA